MVRLLCARAQRVWELNVFRKQRQLLRPCTATVMQAVVLQTHPFDVEVCIGPVVAPMVGLGGFPAARDAAWLDYEKTFLDCVCRTGSNTVAELLLQ